MIAYLVVIGVIFHLAEEHGIIAGILSVASIFALVSEHEYATLKEIINNLREELLK